MVLSIYSIKHWNESNCGKGLKCSRENIQPWSRDLAKIMAEDAVQDRSKM
jgi:hypothetical protein